MKTKLCRPILVETKEPTNIFKDHTGLFHSNLNLQTGHSINSSVIGYNLILISLDPNEKIEVGDKYYDSHNDLILVATAQSDHNVYQYKKVIATQFQLPEEYIQRFVEGYNSGNVKDVEVEMNIVTMQQSANSYEDNDILVNGEVVDSIHYKLYDLTDKIIDRYNCAKPTNGFVTIVDKKEPILYTEEEVKDLFIRYRCFRNENPELSIWDNDQWFQENKKK